ncbi:type I methionyl aminopeptidase [Ruminococcaceae bacterium OttesenSCG-928-L11]|nr:type I methionyl aminopeptidase [Ruminococcaceae bacterium OttesenSCG-928-L11]
MIVLKTSSELELMRVACQISAQALVVGGEMVKPGVTTAQIDKAIHKFIKSQNAIPSFLGYNGFPASACISINDEVIHGIPGGRVIQPGDIVSIDVGALYKGFNGDNAATFAAGEISPEAQRLMDVTRESLHMGIAAALSGNRVGDVSNAVQTYVEQYGFGIVREFVGHGVGKDMHEAPEVPNFGKAGRGPRLTAGMTIAIEPMINMGGGGVKMLSDGWTIKTADGSLSAHFEHTIAITDNGPAILTTP